MPTYFDTIRGCYRVDISRRRPDGQRVRATKLLPKDYSKAQAEAVASKMEADIMIRSQLTTLDSQWPAYVDALAADKSSWFHKTLAQLRSRSKKRGGSSGIGQPELRTLLLRSNGRCEVTGLKFHTQTTGKRHPMAPSVDRIDSAGGYCMGNCRVVCYAANVAMLHWGEEMFGQIATGWVINRYTVMSLAQHLRV